MATGLLAILDDIATLLDDVAVQSKASLKVTAGLIGDDLAVNAKELTGIADDKEIPLGLRVMKGAMINKLIICPIATLLAFFLPAALGWLLILGGLYLCFEGMEKIIHALFHRNNQDEKNQVVQAARLSTEEFMQLEDQKVKGAIRTDFILSMEICFLMLNELQSLNPWVQFVTLLGLSLLVTLGIYGAVIGIIRLDNVGLAMMQKPSQAAKAFGYKLIQAVPYIMKTLAVVGTAAMLLVGGELLVHNIAPVHHAWEAWAPWAPSVVSGVISGILAGTALVAVISLWQRVQKNPQTGQA